jgi:hypothetical protein
MTDLRLTPTIREIVQHPARFKVPVYGRRWGKSRMSLIWLHHGDIQPNGLYWFVAPYRKQAKAIAWPLLKRFARGYGLNGRSFSETELCITWPNGAMTQCHGADNPDSMVGVGLERVVCDEYSRWRPDVWPEIVRPMLTQSKGDAMFPSTPRGYNHLHKLWLRGNDPGDTDWMSWHGMTKDSPFVDPEEVEQARRDMDPWQYRENYEASFETSGNRACYMFDRAKHVIDLQRPQSAKWFIGMDFNVEPMAAVLGAVIGDRRVHYFDEVRIQTNANTPMMIRVIQQRWPGVQLVYPDPTGGARSTTGDKSNHQLLRDAGFRVVAAPAPPEQVDRLNAWNTMLEDATGCVSLTMSPACTSLIEDNERTERTADGGIDKRKRDPHWLDSASYFIAMEYPVIVRVLASSSRWAS